MKVKPILFNTEMVRAILDGIKTCTRRIVKPEPVGFFEVHENPIYIYDTAWNQGRIMPPYQSGDILYVRETWGIYSRNWQDADYYMYRADYPDGATTYTYSDGTVCDLPKWRPSIHMPKEAARIWLKITDVRVERLQDITIDGIRNEGLTSAAVHAGDMEIAFAEWKLLWDKTVNKDEAALYGWNANPWVWVIEFERCEETEGEIC